MHRHRGSGVRYPHVVHPNISGLQVGSLRSVKVIERLVHVQCQVPSPNILSVVNVLVNSFILLLLIVYLCSLNVRVQIRGKIVRFSPLFPKYRRLTLNKVAIMIEMIEPTIDWRKLCVNLALR
jgi:hypothetical protein